MKKYILVLLTFFSFSASAAVPSFLNNEQEAKKAMNTLLAKGIKLQRNPIYSGNEEFVEDFVEGDYGGEYLRCGVLHGKKTDPLYHCMIKDEEVS
jgi:hypothetical protein